ncbi:MULTISPECIES: flagellar biosynthesis protein FlhA [unclassified Pseudomonas]|uniref:flagellar biosynthesis protein FlhA n=1 Tax=unclassified Pseudomonas TaxID=196821 RepID=UPI000876018D|nr:MULTISPECIES: flagellar biosynthesis protein FlhA [unclassified Pseudomonas]SCZ19732.1 flagellar biosynthesis protein FlhA [Pseudomonas sp. NFACC44-2]SDA45785.1 flagellar biosynthesis protein FlhA [Pseudomonas sp. NFACC51]SDB15614.1 flagellar biosynthesis protein FlhA [Pseudomonas sp. NFACC17-2]SEI44695.1 flagellar biosynthesis protein FlhA [Pseudomonas sp. NFACC07-1]SEJ17780.1 flagellar biosynthesis protein FlhA [Pseudomonas sp. NFACC23-1]
MKPLLSRLLSEGSDLLLAVAVIGILLVLFTPIPTWLLDLLLLTNFAVALMVLLVTFDIDKPLSFSTFPSLLLMTTLFRLALNISATRLILTDGDAGLVIAAVGTHVVGGNYVIGFVIFLILVVVQYVVVTSGAQRVAEVAARFTLDSLPGKQMSIDADLNMGIIDQEEAKRRRSQLERESNFYGAMDGASKFVKGDAIAGIVIIAINIIGGLSVGILQKGQSWGDALHHYTLLTVGDGIVTQIPSLIIAVAAGIIITRAATDARLGPELGRQVSAYPKTLVVVALVTLFLAMMPGLPLIPLMMLFCAFAAAAWFSYRKLRDKASVGEDSQKDVLTGQDSESDDVYALMNTDAFELRLSADLATHVLAATSTLSLRIENLRKQFAKDYGFALPSLNVHADKKLASGTYQVCVQGAVIAAGELEFDKLLAINPGGATLVLEGRATKEPTYGLKALWIEVAQRAQARTAGYTLVEPDTVLLTHLSELARRYAPEFLTRAETERLIEKKRVGLGSLVDELVPQVLSYSDIQRVLQLLLREQVSIRNLETILEVLVDAGRSNKSAEDLVERVRERLGAALYERLVDKNGELNVLTIAPQLEGYMLAASRPREGLQSALLPAQELERFVTTVAREAERQLSGNKQPVLLCAAPLRRVLRAFMARAVPHMAVLSVNEVGQHARVTSAGMIDLPGFPSLESP